MLLTKEDGTRALQSFSGHERNRLFLNVEGQQFEDFSVISGLDSASDGRSVALWDFDHDGWQDFAVVNANAPLLNIYRNQTGSRKQIEGNFIALRFHGGSNDPKPSSSWSNRDGYGAVITVTCGDRKYVRERRCSEGFSAQNSATMIVGIGKAKRADSISIRWPSGKTQNIGSIEAGKLISIYENPEHTDSPNGYETSSY